MMTNGILLSPLEQLMIAVGKQDGVYVHEKKCKTNQEISQSVAVVINYIITDAFNLSGEESLWLGQTLQQILKPISALRPQMYLAAVVTELDEGRYSSQLLAHADLSTSGAPVISSAKQATVTEWADMMSEIVLTSYPDLRANIQSQVIGALYFALQSVGLTDDVKTARKSNYLPTAVREMLNVHY